MVFSRLRVFGLVLLCGSCSNSSENDPADGLSLLRVFPKDADQMLAPATRMPAAYFRVPAGKTAADFAADEIAPGIARVRKLGPELLSFGKAHPELAFELSAPLHLLNDRTGSLIRTAGAYAQGVTGEGVYVGIADTGIDVAHPDFQTPDGKTRIAWLLDLSRKPRGIHKAEEDAFKITDRAGNSIGAVYTGSDIDDLIAFGKTAELPTDVNGHGTHVSSIAAGAQGPSKFPNPDPCVARGAKLVVVRLTRTANSGIETDDLVTAARFIFDRADNDKKPAVVNMSLGTDFGPHDGTLLWEQAIASNVGPTKPGHVVVAAAGNSGSIEDPVHQSVYVAEGSPMRVPVISRFGARAGRVQIWITKRAGAQMDIGLEGPDGTWIDPVSPGREQGRNREGYSAGIFHGVTPQSPVPRGSDGAIVLWSGAWPAGEYKVVLQGKGSAELYLQTYGDADSQAPTRFKYGVRAGTINMPASHPSILSVGCTVGRTRWRSISKLDLGPVVPNVDPLGSLPAAGAREPQEGEVCWFSSAGPTAKGAAKPEIAAPGAGVVAAMSGQATPADPASIFDGSRCPNLPDGSKDTRCLQITDRHAVSSGTSMSSPVVAGTVALLLQKDPTLTQEQVTRLLQAGARPFRGKASYLSQSGPGEVDAVGALNALEQTKTPKMVQPSPLASWLAASTDFIAADGSNETLVTLQLRSADGSERADGFDLSKLRAEASVDGAAIPGDLQLTRIAPGLFQFRVRAPEASGGRSMTLGASYEGVAIVTPRTLPIAPDGWRASYPPTVSGGCGTSPASPKRGAWLLLPLLALLRRRRMGDEASYR
jgi:subtilisin family serine protease